MVKNLPANAGGSGGAGSIPGLGQSPSRKWQPAPVFLPGRRSLAGYSAWDHKESDMTERLSTHARAHTHTHTHTHRELRSHLPLRH